MNATARSALEDYLHTIPPAAVVLFPSEKTGHALRERALGYLMTKYATHARTPTCSRMTCGIALGIGWPKPFHCIAWPKSWDMTRSTPP